MKLFCSFSFVSKLIDTDGIIDPNFYTEKILHLDTSKTNIIKNNIKPNGGYNNSSLPKIILYVTIFNINNDLTYTDKTFKYSDNDFINTEIKSKKYFKKCRHPIPRKYEVVNSKAKAITINEEVSYKEEKTSRGDFFKKCRCFFLQI